MLLMSSVHLDSMHTAGFELSPITTALKLEAMRQVREKIRTQAADDIISCISAIACLATCALVSDSEDWAGDSPVGRKTVLFGYQVLCAKA